MTNQQLKLIHKEEQIWAGLTEYLEDIKRIAESGPQDIRDSKLTRAVLYYVTGKMLSESLT